MIRVIAGAALLACTLVALLAAPAAAEAPAGPRLTFMRGSGSTYALVSSDPTGHDQRVLAKGSRNSPPIPNLFSPPTWSGNGSQVAFSALSSWSKGHLDIYQAAADGNGLRKLPHTRDAFKPVLSPDGRTLAFGLLRQRRARRAHGREAIVFDGASTWLLNVKGGRARRLTPWRNGLYEYPSSFSPDGKTLALSLTRRVSERRSIRSALALRLDGSGSRVLAEDAGSPVYSPDGSRIALLLMDKPRIFKTRRGLTTITPTDLAVAAADGSGLTRLTHTSALELLPSWDPSGQRLAYTQQRASGRDADIIGLGDSIMEINADGSCRTRVLSYPRAILYGPTWQAGAGREAGPIAC
ncbi:MAG TPA: hypothetical protein VFN82_02145 [Solirubrobacterales bacterium]|nr:hypothetical protein [Solirubrobacterales bacterium]